MKKGYVISLVLIGALIVVSVLVLMDDLNNKSFNDTLNPQTQEKTTEKAENKRTPAAVEAQKNANPNTTNITIDLLCCLFSSFPMPPPSFIH